MRAYKKITNLEPMEMTFTVEDADLDKLYDMAKDINVNECPWFEVQDKHGNKAKYYREPQWIPCSERLPKENVYVLVWCGEVKIARIIRGISKEQRAKMQEGAIDDPVSYGWNSTNEYFKVKRSESYRACDEHGNNKVPYCWDCIYGEMFGQDVKAWMPLPKQYREEGERE